MTTPERIDLTISLPFRCGCGRPLVLEAPPEENLHDSHDQLNVARLLWHFGHHHAHIVRAAKQYEAAALAWQSEGGR